MLYMTPEEMRSVPKITCAFCGWTGYPWEQHMIYVASDNLKKSRTVMVACPECDVAGEFTVDATYRKIAIENAQREYDAACENCNAWYRLQNAMESLGIDAKQSYEDMIHDACNRYDSMLINAIVVASGYKHEDIRTKDARTS